MSNVLDKIELLIKVTPIFDVYIDLNSRSSMLSSLTHALPLQDEFMLKSYSRKELASHYWPNSSPKTACQNLRRWLLSSSQGKELMQRIKRRRILSKSDVRDIVSLLGEP